MSKEERIKRIRVSIPNEIKNKFQGYETVSFGIVYCRPIPHGDFVGEINIYLHSKQARNSPSVTLPITSIRNLRYRDNGDFVREVENIAYNSNVLTKLIVDGFQLD